MEGLGVFRADGSEETTWAVAEGRNARKSRMTKGTSKVHVLHVVSRLNSSCLMFTTKTLRRQLRVWKSGSSGENR